MEARINEIKEILKGLNYTENGMPIGIDPELYGALTQELETLEC